MPIPSLDQPPDQRVRHETKFLVPARCFTRVAAWLEHQCVPDPAFAENGVKSLYFDSGRLALLRQKQASELLKRKVRIRWYVNPRTGRPDPGAMLEAKIKDGARGWKHRIPLPVDTAELDADPLGVVQAWLSRVDPAEPKRGWLQGLQPVCVIRYVRRRYVAVSGGWRIALDSAIRAESLNPLVLRGHRARRPGSAVLEVKGPGARGLPPSLAFPGHWGVRKASFSKYAACLEGDDPLETYP